MKPKLSICIPTYNRANFLVKQLDEIYIQIDKYGLEDKVEVIVSNNASPDDTSKKVDRFITKGLIYNEQEKNIGPDANFFTLFDMANGEFVWLLGDDDSFSSDVLRYIIKVTTDSKIDYLYLRTFGDINDDESRSGYICGNVELFKRALINTSFMSSQVIRNDLIIRFKDEAKGHFGDLMAYFYLFIKCLESSNKCMISDFKEIYMEADNTGGYKFYQVWGRGILDVFVKTELGKNKKLLSMFKNDLLFKLIIPCTSGFRRNKLKSNLDSSSAIMFMSKYFGSGWRSYVFGAYQKSPVVMLKHYDFLLRVLNAFRKIKNKPV